MLLVCAFIVLTSSCLVSSSSWWWRNDIHTFVSNATIADIRFAVQNKTFTCQALAAAQTLRIQQFNSQLGAYITYNAASIQEQAKAIDASGVKESAKLTCVLMAVQDNIDVKGVPTTNGARLMQQVIPSIDSFMVSRMREHQAIILGKTNMAELSIDDQNSKSTVGGQCKNPYDLTRTCMGSAGGSAAAVAAGLATVGLGIDTKGSLIGPANVNNLYGFRPGSALTNATYLDGVYPTFSRMDEVGFLTRNMDDMLTLQEAAYGKFTKDSLAKMNGMNWTSVVALLDVYSNISISDIGVQYFPDPKLDALFDKFWRDIQHWGNAALRTLKMNNLFDVELRKIIDASSAKSMCYRSCAKKSIDAYFGNTQRFPNGQFKSAEALYRAGSADGLPKSYLDTLNFTISQIASEVCSDLSMSSCKSYLDAQQSMSTFLLRLMRVTQSSNNRDADILAVPFGPKFAHKWNTVPSMSDRISAVLTPYLGWPSITVPIGFSDDVSEEAPFGIPSGMVLMSKPENTGKLLSFAYAYDKAFFKFRLPPMFTPEIKSADNVRSLGLVNAMLVTISLLYINFK